MFHQLLPALINFLVLVLPSPVLFYGAKSEIGRWEYEGTVGLELIIEGNTAHKQKVYGRVDSWLFYLLYPTNIAHITP